LAVPAISISAAAEEDIAFTGTAAGAALAPGSGLANSFISFVATADGVITIPASAELDISLETEGDATYSIAIPGDGSFEAAFVALAIGEVEIPASAELQIGFGGIAAQLGTPAECSASVTFLATAVGAFIIPPEYPFVKQPLIFGVPAILTLTEAGPPQSQQPGMIDQPVATQTLTPGNGPWPPA
jgi:hypothetical protein